MFFCCPLKVGRCNYFEWVTLEGSKSNKKSLGKKVLPQPVSVSTGSTSFKPLKNTEKIKQHIALLKSQGSVGIDKEVLKRSNSLGESPKKKEMPNKIDPILDTKVSPLTSPITSPSGKTIESPTKSSPNNDVTAKIQSKEAVKIKLVLEDDPGKVSSKAILTLNEIL
jgi:hypothetical protein